MLTPLVLAAAAPIPECRQTLYRADGGIAESRVQDPGQGSATSATTSASGQRSSHSSVSVSASDNGSTASTSSSESRADGKRRSVTVTRDQSGCRIVIDERPSEGNDP